MTKPTTSRTLAALAAALVLAAPEGALRAADDTALFSTAVPPNVMLLVDNSGSMEHVVWHPAFDPAGNPTCNHWNDNETYFVHPSYTTSMSGGSPNPADTSIDSDPASYTACSNTRKIFNDTVLTTAPLNDPTRWSGLYLNWYFSDAADTYAADIVATANGTISTCLGGGTFGKYRRSRITALKNILRDVICQVNATGEVRFGVAQFRTGSDPHGGFVRVPINDYGVPNYTLNGVTQSHGDHLDAFIDALDPETWTPLAESLFQVYTYFMSRTDADIPLGKDATTKFPKYNYRTSDGSTVAAGFPGDPVQYACQKNFVIIITDGEPTKDDFDTDVATTDAGFADFLNKLIGDYNADGEVEGGAGVPAGCIDECALYLDDVAKFMQDKDFRPDLADAQGIDTYTVGFTTTPFANTVLSKTAQVGNGKFFSSSNAEELSAAIVDSVTDIIQKSQSFTAATVPATRTASGGNLYTSLFVPSDKQPWWEGHLSAFQITPAGELRDSNNDCVVDDPNAPAECFSGPIKPTCTGAPAPSCVVPYWDAGKQVPAPASRTLYTSKVSGTPQREDFNTTQMTAADLGVTNPPNPYTGSTAGANAETLADEIVQSARGCTFGTGVGAIACSPRTWLLGDIFHSNPVVVGSPSSVASDASYFVFRGNYLTRDRMIYAGANDGFLHAINAGDWNPAATPPDHDRGTGVEVFGFMPYPSRQTIKNQPLDTGTRDYYFVDGSPAAADVWFYPGLTQATKAASGSEWRTIAVGGLRQGGNAYYALDVTDPGATSCAAPATGADYPCYLWEFPAENASATLKATMGETWSEPILTKIRVKVGTNDNLGQGFERWVAIVGGGYHAASDPNDQAAYDPVFLAGRALYVVDLKTGQILAQKKFDVTGAATADPLDDQMRYAIPSTPAVYDLDFDGFADVIYAGDLGGNVWKWVITDLGVQNNDGTYAVDQTQWPFKRFFQAPSYVDASGTGLTYYKSFFFPPGATFKSGKLWLAFGSGERANLLFEGNAGTLDDNNRFYAVTDLDPLEELATPYPTLDEGDLLDVTGDSSCADVSATRGYFFVGEEGEKWITNVEVFFYYVFVASYVPEVSTDPCETGGKSYLYVFKVYCGEGYFTDAGGNPAKQVDLGAGMPTDPRLTISPEEGGNRVIITQQEGEISNFETPPGFGSGIGQFYWRELQP